MTMIILFLFLEQNLKQLGSKLVCSIWRRLVSLVKLCILLVVCPRPPSSKVLVSGGMSSMWAWPAVCGWCHGSIGLIARWKWAYHMTEHCACHMMSPSYHTMVYWASNRVQSPCNMNLRKACTGPNDNAVRPERLFLGTLTDSWIWY